MINTSNFRNSIALNNKYNLLLVYAFRPLFNFNIFSNDKFYVEANRIDHLAKC